MKTNDAVSFPSPGGGVARLAFLSLILLLSVGCQRVSSTARRGTVVGLGAGAAGAASYYAFDKKPEAALAGAAGGALLTHMALGEDPELLQRGFDQGYLQGQSDAIKRQYFLRLAEEARPFGNQADGRPVSYFLPGPELGPDGTKKEPHLLELRVVE